MMYFILLQKLARVPIKNRLRQRVKTMRVNSSFEVVYVYLDYRWLPFRWFPMAILGYRWLSLGTSRSFYLAANAEDFK